MEELQMRTTTWNGLGTDVKGKTITDVLKESGLDYEVEKQSIMLADGTIVPDRCATVKSGTSEILGVVSNRYEICQNTDAFEFINSVSDVEFVKAGETNSGMVYVIGKLPDVKVLNDEFTPYLIFQNGHNGRYTLKTTITPLRLVCQNQFNYAFHESPNTISIQHSRQYVAKLQEAEKLIKGTVRYMNQFNNTAEELAMLKLGNDSNVKQIINSFFTLAEDATDRQIARVEDNRNELFNAYKSDDNANFTGTAWGLINGFSDYVTHKDSKASEENKFLSVTFDPRMFMSFVQHVRQFA